MSAFTESALIKKLLDLNSSQQSIQTLSLWLIHHRKHHVGIIKTWFRELQKASQSKKLTFMYLANDVIQNSKKKGPEYGKEFGIALHKVFKHIGDNCDDEKLFTSLNRILNIWDERGVYDNETIKSYRKELLKNVTTSKTTVTKKSDIEKRKSTDDTLLATTEATTGPAAVAATVTGTGTKRQKLSNTEKKEKTTKTETIEINGKVETHVTLSPHVPLGDPPEPEELIKALTDLENSASSDAVVRERIANLPAEISEISSLSKLEDKEAALKMVKQVNEAVQLLNEYNSRLANEMEDRKKLATMLRDFHAEQKELLAQAEQRLEEYNTKLMKMKEVQKEIRDHLSNLPDLRQLPDVTGGLAPLPSAGDLFNVH